MPISEMGPPQWLNGKRIHLQCKRCGKRGFDGGLRKIPSRRKWQPTPLFLPGESHGLRAWQATVYRVANTHTHHI